MLDPFSPRIAGKANFLLLGGICVICEEKEGRGAEAGLAAVCLDCSVFYSKRFCIDCAAENIHHFPVEVHGRAVGTLFAFASIDWTVIPLAVGAVAKIDSN